MVTEIRSVAVMTMTTSGPHVLPGVALVHEGVEQFRSTCVHDVSWWFERYGVAAEPGRAINRCHNQPTCRSYYDPRMPAPNLGIVSYCPTCLEALAAECLELHGRLPDATERLCPRCLQIVSCEQWAPRERDGRRRNRCLACYRTFVWHKNRRQTQRR